MKIAITKHATIRGAQRMPPVTTESKDYAVVTPARPAAARWRRPAGIVLAVAAVLGIGAYWSVRNTVRPGEIHYRKGIELAEDQQIGEAEREWLTGIHDDPTFAGCYKKLGDLYFDSGNMASAAARYSAA